MANTLRLRSCAALLALLPFAASAANWQGDEHSGPLRFVATQAVASLLNGRQVFSGSDRVIWSGNVHEGSVGGWPAYSSTHVPSGHLIFGAWASLVLAEWGESIEL